MIDYMQPHDGPVIDGLEDFECVYAANQPEYLPLRTLVCADGRVVSRWALTPEQRKAVAEGADIFLELSTFFKPLQPIRMAVGDGKADCPADVPMIDEKFLKSVGIKADNYKSDEKL